MRRVPGGPRGRLVPPPPPGPPRPLAPAHPRRPRARSQVARWRRGRRSTGAGGGKPRGGARSMASVWWWAAGWTSLSPGTTLCARPGGWAGQAAAGSGRAPGGALAGALRRRGGAAAWCPGLACNRSWHPRPHFPPPPPALAPLWPRAATSSPPVAPRCSKRRGSRGRDQLIWRSLPRMPRAPTPRRRRGRRGPARWRWARCTWVRPSAPLPAFCLSWHCPPIFLLFVATLSLGAWCAVQGAVCRREGAARVVAPWRPRRADPSCLEGTLISRPAPLRSRLADLPPARQAGCACAAGSGPRAPPGGG